MGKLKWDGDRIHVATLKRAYSNNTTQKEGRTPKKQGMKLDDEIKMKI